MIEIGLKLFSVNENYVKSAVKLYEQKVYDYIELYVVPNSFDDSAKLWKELKIPFIIHAPHFRHGVNLAQKECEANNMLLATEAKRFADILDAEYIIFHPGIAGEEREAARQFNLINDKRILIENKPYFTVLGDGNICNGNSPEQIKFLLDETRLGFCLDIGHCFCAANAKNIAPFDYLKQFLAFQPELFHLTDNSFASPIDKHLHFGDGDFDVEKILNYLPENYKITLETVKNSQENLDDFINDSNTVKNLDFQIKKAELSDMEDIFNLSNDEDVRKNSFNSEKIIYDDHVNWFTDRIYDENTYFYVIRNKKSDELISQVRFERETTLDFTVSISISRKFRGKNYATKLLKILSSDIIKKNQNSKINASIKSENTASINAFESAGYNKINENNEKILLEYKL